MIKEICKRLEFPNEATEEFLAAYEKIILNNEAMSLFEKAQDEVFMGEQQQSYKPYVEEAAEALKMDLFVVNAVFWLMTARLMKYIYKSQNISEDMMWENLKDLKYKLNECKKYNNSWGLDCYWFRNFYRGTRLTYGRLQYDVDIWQEGSYRGMVEDGDLTFRCHIPSSGPLYPQSVMDSLKMLYEAQKDRLKNGILVVHCNSWLLYPPIIERCSENSNMRKFYDLFDIIRIHERKTPFIGFKTIFGINYDGPETLNKVPTDTGLRKAMKTYFEEGGIIASGVGAILFDGEKII